MSKLSYLLAGTILLGSSLGFATTNQNSVSPSHTAIAATVEQLHDKSVTKRPPTKIATISVEGEPTQITLRLYNRFSNLFITYFPEKDFVPESFNSDEGYDIRFFTNFGGIKNNRTYVQFVFRNDLKNLTQVRNAVTGRRGIIASQGWRITGKTTNTSYSWAKEIISFNTRRNYENIIGNVYIGQQNGRAFYVVEHYPVEFGDGFPPRADLILKELRVSR